MSIRYNYNRQITPPAPCVYVSISRPDDESLVAENLAAQLDTGADISVIPAAVVDRLQLVALDQMLISGFGGHIRRAPIYLVGLAVHNFDRVLLRAVASRDEPYVLLGRDVLNRHRVLLDGPNLVVEISSP